MSIKIKVFLHIINADCEKILINNRGETKNEH